MLLILLQGSLICRKPAGKVMNWGLTTLNFANSFKLKTLQPRIWQNTQTLKLMVCLRDTSTSEFDQSISNLCPDFPLPFFFSDHWFLPTESLPAVFLFVGKEKITAGCKMPASQPPRENGRWKTNVACRSSLMDPQKAENQKKTRGAGGILFLLFFRQFWNADAKIRRTSGEGFWYPKGGLLNLADDKHVSGT